MPPRLDRRQRMPRRRLWMAGRLHQHLERQIDDGGEIAGGNEQPVLPGCPRGARIRADADAIGRDTGQLERARRGRGVPIDRDAGIHQPHMPRLGHETLAEATAADNAGLDGRPNRAVELVKMQGVHPSRGPEAMAA